MRSKVESTNKILVTGATGFIGSAIAEKLVEEGFSVITTTRIQSEADGVSLVYMDLSKPESILNLVDDGCYDVIIHFGSRIGWSGESEEELFISNVIATGLLANIAFEAGARFIFSSAAMVCGVTTELITNKTPINPDTSYGKSKWLAEEMIRASGAKSCILRIGGVFGLNGPNHLGLNRAISGAIKQIVPQQYGSCNALRNYVYLWDVVEAVTHIIRNNIEGTHLIAGSEQNSVRLMLEEVCDVFMPGKRPEQHPGDDATNQLIVPSDDLPKTRNLRSALEDIRSRVVAK